MKYRVAVLSDSHGNYSALKAVLEDAKQLGTDEFWSLGDIAFGGPGSEECYQLLEDVGTSQYLMGNWESSFNELMEKRTVNFDDPSDIYFIMLVKYDLEHFSKERIDQLKKLPMTGRKKVFQRVFSLSHNLPNKNYGHEILPVSPQENFDKIGDDPNVDCYLFAHIHSPLWRYTSSGQIILNPGSVGQAWFSRQRLLKNRDASYLLLTISERGMIDVDFRRVNYDQQKELDFAIDNDFPYVELYRKLLLTGYASTHDKDLLAKINKDKGYRQQAVDFVKDLKDV